MADLPVKTRRRKFLLAFHPDLYDAVKAHADARDITVTDVMRLAALQYLAATPPLDGKGGKGYG